MIYIRITVTPSTLPTPYTLRNVRPLYVRPTHPSCASVDAYSALDVFASTHPLVQLTSRIGCILKHCAISFFLKKIIIIFFKIIF
jgi:hypothetical protein